MEFNWQSETAGKHEYHQLYSLLNRNCGSYVFTLTHNATERYRPMAPVQPAVGPFTDYEKLLVNYQMELRMFFSKFDQAISILRSSFKYGCKAAEDIEKALTTIPPNLTEEQWNPELQLRAALLKLADNYAPKDATDVASLRLLLSELNDESSGGFYEYSQEFVRIYGALAKAQHVPSATECTEWVKKGLKNSIIKVYLATSVFTIANPSPLYEDIFASVINFLKILGEDSDPYKTVNAGPTSKPTSTAMAVGTKQESRCTRCWRTGHKWSECNAKTCSACENHTRIEGSKYCPQWETHKEKSTRYVPKSLLAKKDSSPKTSKTSQDASVPSKEQVEEARKAYQAMANAIKKDKKRKKEDDE